jgi:DNA-binding beta-propeller fold protein YncE
MRITRIATEAAVLLLGLAVQAAGAEPLRLDARIALPEVRGRIDHLAIDSAHRRLFVAALGSDSVEVIDLDAARRVERLRNLREPQGVAYAEQEERLFVANGGGGIDVFDAGRRTARIDDLDDADNLRLDGGGRLYVGYAEALAVIDVKTLAVTRRIALPAHPESFQLSSSGDRIYVNVPGARQIAVVGRREGKVVASWPIVEASRNFSMALDEAAQRLFVATRSPALLLAYDTGSGRMVASLPTCGDADDLFLDDKRRQLYVVCGAGKVEVVRELSPGRYALVASIATSPGARTGLFVPRLETLFVAAPAAGQRQAEVLVFRIE